MWLHERPVEEMSAARKEGGGATKAGAQWHPEETGKRMAKGKKWDGFSSAGQEATASLCTSKRWYSKERRKAGLGKCSCVAKSVHASWETPATPKATLRSRFLPPGFVNVLILDSSR